MVVVLFVLSGVCARAEEFSWQKTHAEISSAGDIKWLPNTIHGIRRPQEMRNDAKGFTLTCSSVGCTTGAQ